MEYMTRVTGFFSKVNNWNKGKLAERRDRTDAKKANKQYFEHGMSKEE